MMDRLQDSNRSSIPAFEDANKHLFVNFNDFMTALESGKSVERLCEILNSSCRFAQQYFQREELWLASRQDPALVEHRSQHRQFMMRLETMLVEVKAGRLRRCGAEVQVLREMLVSQILRSDKEYARRYQVVHTARPAATPAAVPNAIPAATPERRAPRSESAAPRSTMAPLASALLGRFIPERKESVEQAG